MGQRRSTKSLWVALIVAILLTGAVTYFGGHLLKCVEDDDLAEGLGNIAGVGGVASGLSLAGTSVLTLNSSAVARLRDNYGGWIRSILFGGYTLMVLASFAAVVGAMFSDWSGAPWLAAGTASIIILGLITTSALINSAFRWAETDA